MGAQEDLKRWQLSVFWGLFLGYFALAGFVDPYALFTYV